MLSVAAIAVRALLLLFGAVVLGVSVTLAKQQQWGSPPSETSFGSFTGAFGIIAAAVGLAGLWVDAIPSLVTMGIDALASVFYLAGGIALTVALKKDVSSCTDTDTIVAATRWTNKLLNGGCTEGNDHTQLFCGVQDFHDPVLISRCQRVQADFVFQYLGFVFGLGIIVLGFMLHKRGGTSHSYV